MIAHEWRAHGFCELTSAGTGSRCLPEDVKGVFTGVDWNERAARTLSSCVTQCQACVQCYFISFSFLYHDCSWFHTCNIHQLQQKVVGKPGYMPGSHLTFRIRLDNGSVVVPSLSTPGTARRAVSRNSVFATHTGAVDSCNMLAGGVHRRARLLKMPTLRCDERYVSMVYCGGLMFMFSRRDVPDASDEWETVVRVRDGHDSSFSAPIIALHQGMRMSHNAAFACLHDNRTLVALGGQAYWRSGDEKGVMRRSLHVPPIHKREGWRPSDRTWSHSKLAVAGDPSVSACVEERPLQPLPEGCPPHTCPRPMGGFTCEFDGKLSLVVSRRKLLLFTRSNPYRDGGGRHVQVASASARYPEASFSRFRLVNFAQTPRRQEDNIYFFTAQALPASRRLLGFFPAVLGGHGGVYCAVTKGGDAGKDPAPAPRSAYVCHWLYLRSPCNKGTMAAEAARTHTHALRACAHCLTRAVLCIFAAYWTAPIIILQSDAINGTRIRDWPVDIPAAPLVDELQLIVQHKVLLHHNQFQLHMCRVTEAPMVCEYHLPRILQIASPDSVCSRIAAVLV